MSYFGVSLRNGVGLGLGTVPSLTNTPLSYRLAPSLDLSFAGSDSLSPAITFSRTSNATLTNSAGLVDYAPTNLLTFSEQFDNAAWLKFQIGTGVVPVVTANTSAAPDGTLTADTVVFVAPVSGDQSGLTRSPSTSAGTYTGSFYVKATGASDVGKILGFRHVAGGAYTLVTLTSSWQRVTATEIRAGDNFEINLRPALGTSSGTVSAQLWGAQLETSSTASTYNSTTVKNLLGFTENFDNAAWTKSNASITSGFTDIYGQPFAQKLVENTATGVHEINQTVSLLNTPICISVYAKVGERSKFRLDMTDLATGDAFADFDLTAVSATFNSNGSWSNASASISSIGNGWYRCSLIATKGAGTSANAKLQLSNGAATSYTGDGTSGIYIFGAQLSDSASVDPYVYQPVAAPTSTAYYGPRFDYDPVTLQPKGLLIEEQRTNLLTFSEQFDDATWVKSTSTITANTAIAPNGSITADTVAFTSGSSQIYQQQTLGTGVFTYSTYVKRIATDLFVLDLSDASTGDANVTYALNSGTISTSGASGSWSQLSGTITSVGDGWYRCTLTATKGAGTSVIAKLQTTAAGSFYIWGAQLEAGAFATSYIPTVASQVTRAADNASMIGNNFARWYNATEGTLFTQALPSEVPASDAIVRFAAAIYDKLTYTNAVRLERIGGAFRDVQTVSGSSVIATATWNIGVVGKVAGAYANSNSAAVFNAGTVSSLSGSVPTGITQLGIGGNGSSGNNWCGHISRISYYNRRLSNTELQGITS